MLGRLCLRPLDWTMSTLWYRGQLIECDHLCQFCLKHKTPSIAILIKSMALATIPVAHRPRHSTEAIIVHAVWTWRWEFVACLLRRQKDTTTTNNNTNNNNNSNGERPLGAARCRYSALMQDKFSRVEHEDKDED
ncbi:hypothetical protein SNK03_008460 [Fusarium graminearum]